MTVVITDDLTWKKITIPIAARDTNDLGGGGVHTNQTFSSHSLGMPRNSADSALLQNEAMAKEYVAEPVTYAETPFQIYHWFQADPCYLSQH